MRCSLGTVEYIALKQMVVLLGKNAIKINTGNPTRYTWENKDRMASETFEQCPLLLLHEVLG